MGDNEATTARNFIQEIIDGDLKTGKWDGRVHTRFPPEPNGYLHIGHAKSICLNFGLAQEYGGKCNLRFDDTNPVKEEEEYVQSIKEDVRWLGFDWNELRFGSDYFKQMYEWAVELIKKGKAYVCELNAEQTREHRGTLTKPGAPSPFRDRPVDENLDLFDRMRKGEFPDGSRTLKAKIDMTHPNINMRDPVMYRILHADHHRTGDKWCIYPMYDWAHGLEDSIEGITHSICTLEFENHRPLYDWFIEAINEDRGPDSPYGPHIVHSQQIEFARLNLNYTIMSKRRLLELVQDDHVHGWDDPRMPTVSGMRRRGYTPEAIREFCRRIGVAKFDGISEMALLEHCVRDDLNKRAPRVMGVLRPLKLVIDNYPDEQTELLDAINNPEDPEAGVRKIPFSKTLYIEQNDFMSDPPRKFFRLAPGREVRLRYAYFVTCTDVVKNDAGEIVEIHCTYDPATRGGDSPDGRKVKGTIHWVSADHALDIEARLYDHLFTSPDPSAVPAGGDYKDNLNHDSLDTLSGAKLESSWEQALNAKGPHGEPYVSNWPDGIRRVQFERQGYFCLDPDTTTNKLVFNRTVSLKDSWTKMQKSQKEQKVQKGS